MIAGFEIWIVSVAAAAWLAWRWVHRQRWAFPWTRRAEVIETALRLHKPVEIKFWSPLRQEFVALLVTPAAVTAEIMTGCPYPNGEPVQFAMRRLWKVTPVPSVLLAELEPPRRQFQYWREWLVLICVAGFATTDGWIRRAHQPRFTADDERFAALVTAQSDHYGRWMANDLMFNLGPLPNELAVQLPPANKSVRMPLASTEKIADLSRIPSLQSLGGSSRAPNLAETNDGIAFATLEPNLAAQFYRRAEYRLRTGDRNGAFTDYTRAIMVNPAYEQAYLDRAKLQIRFGALEDARRDCMHAIDIAPYHSAAYFTRATIWQLEHEWVDALADLDRVLKLNPHHAIAYNDRAWLHAKLGKLTEALKDANLAIQFEPRIPDFYDTRGWMKFFNHQERDAIFDCVSAAKLAGRSRSAAGFSASGLAFYIQHKYDVAVQEWRLAVTINPALKDELEPWIAKALAFKEAQPPLLSLHQF